MKAKIYKAMETICGWLIGCKLDVLANKIIEGGE